MGNDSDRNGSPKTLAVLTGRDTHCLQKLVDDIRGGKLNARLLCILSNHGEAASIAAAAGVPFEHHPADNLTAHLAWLSKRLDQDRPDFIVLARYMRILPPELVAKYPSRIINIHPTLEPQFPGPQPYRKTFESGVRLHGCTAHFVTERLDEGPIIAQDVFAVDVGRDTLESIREKGLTLEGQVLSRAVKLALAGELTVRNGKVIYGSPISAAAV